MQEKKRQVERYQAALSAEAEVREQSNTRGQTSAAKASVEAERLELERHRDKIEAEQEQIRAAIKIQSRYKGVSTRTGGIHANHKVRERKHREVQDKVEAHDRAMEAAHARAREVVFEYNRDPEPITSEQEVALALVKGKAVSPAKVLTPAITDIIADWGLDYKYSLHALPSEGDSTIRVLLMLSRVSSSCPIPSVVVRIYFSVHPSDDEETPACVTYHVEGQRLEVVANPGEKPHWLNAWPQRTERDKDVLKDIYVSLGI